MVLLNCNGSIERSQFSELSSRTEVKAEKANTVTGRDGPSPGIPAWALGGRSVGWQGLMAPNPQILAGTDRGNMPATKESIFDRHRSHCQCLGCCNVYNHGTHSLIADVVVALAMFRHPCLGEAGGKLGFGPKMEDQFIPLSRILGLLFRHEILTCRRYVEVCWPS